MSLSDQPSDSKPSAPRKPYTSPRLVSYGHVKDIIQGGGGKKSDATGTPPGGNSKVCWIAEELYGVDDPRTLLLRAWLTRVYASRGRGWRFVALYNRYGLMTARAIARGYLPRALFRRVFDALVEHAFDASASVVFARRPGA